MQLKRSIKDRMGMPWGLPAALALLGALMLAGLLLAGCGTTSGAQRGTEPISGGAGERGLAGATDPRGLGRVETVAVGGGAQHALVIGNSRYQHSPLRNPGNDARDMAAVLRERGFTVTLHEDLNSARFQDAVRRFGERLQSEGGTGLVFFAGHGVEVEGENFLIPVDNDRIRDPIDVRQYALSVNYLLARVEAAGNPLNVVILDACRDNPYAGSTRSLNRGLVGGVAPRGTVIAYATAPGRTADDNVRGRNGLYTEHLIQAIGSGQRVEDVFQQVRRSVLQASGGRQEPWYNASLDGIYCIGGCAPMVVGLDTLSTELLREREATARLEAALSKEHDRIERERLASELAMQRQREEAERERIETQRRQEAAERERLAAELEAQRRERERLEAERQRLQASASISESTAAVAPSGSISGAGLIAGRYQVRGSNGEIIHDTTTGLLWQRCSVGQSWNGSTCIGEGAVYTWDQARQMADRVAGWRLPSKDELRALVYCSSGQPARFKNSDGRCEGQYQQPTILAGAFPNTPSSYFWSASPDARHSHSAWDVDFGYGNANSSYRSHRLRVRLVRGGQ